MFLHVYMPLTCTPGRDWALNEKGIKELKTNRSSLIIKFIPIKN